MRMADLHVGDIINKNPDDPRGWFEVFELQPLPNDGLAVLASTSKNSINGSPNDIVGVQIRQAVQVPDAPAAPVAASEPEAPAPAPQPAPAAQPQAADASRAPQPETAASVQTPNAA